MFMTTVSGYEYMYNIYMYINIRVRVCVRLYIIRFVLGCQGMKKGGKTTVLSNTLHSNGLACSFCARR